MRADRGLRSARPARAHVGEFVARLFRVDAERERQRDAVRRELDTVFLFRSEIVAKVEKHFKGVATSDWEPRPCTPRSSC